jgi:hypothetical protein
MAWPNETLIRDGSRIGARDILVETTTLPREVRWPYPDQPPAYIPKKTSAVPAAIRPTLKALRVCPMRFRE